MNVIAEIDRSSADDIGMRPGPAWVAGRAGVFPVLLITVLVFLVIFPWHALNRRLPVWDSADYVLTAQKIAASIEQGPREGMRSLYLERGWQPILFPSIAAPIFALTGGSVLLSVGLVQSLNVLIVALYVYAFFRRSMSEKRAVLGALMVVSLPWVVNFSHLFYSELFWLAATSGMVFHMTMALQTRSRLHGAIAGVWMGLMVATRPVETVVICALPAALLLFAGSDLGLRRSLTALGLFVCHLLPISIAVVLTTSLEPNYAAVAGLVALSLAILYIWRREWLRHLVLGCLIVGEFVALAWHLPTVRAYLGSEATAVGLLTQLSSAQFSGLSPLTILTQVMPSYSPSALAVVATTAVAGAIWLRWRDFRETMPPGVVVALMGLAMLVPMVVLGSLTGAVDYRRIMPPVFLMYVGLTGIALAYTGALSRARAVCIAIVALLQVTGAAANGLNVRASTQPLRWVQTQLRVPDVSADPNEAALAGLVGLGLWAGNITAHTHCYRNWAQCEQEGMPAFEPVALSTLARERGVPLHVHFAGTLDFSKPETLAAQIKYQNFQYVLVDMVDSPAPINTADGYSVHAEEFLVLVRKAQLPPGLVSRGCFSTMNRPICVLDVR